MTHKLPPSVSKMVSSWIIRSASIKCFFSFIFSNLFRRIEFHDFLWIWKIFLLWLLKFFSRVNMNFLQHISMFKVGIRRNFSLQFCFILFYYIFISLFSTICCMWCLWILSKIPTLESCSTHGFSAYTNYAHYNQVSRRDSEQASLSSGRADSDTMSISSMSV